MFVVRVLVGTIAMILSVPYFLVGTICLLGNRDDWATWWIDNCPISKWFDYVEGR